MVELPLVFIAGILGSSHCLGMCGPFAVAIGGSSSHLTANLGRQLLYSVGRIFTYAVLGAIVGFGGWRIAKAMPAIINLPAIFAIAAGALLVWQGLSAAGILRRKTVTGQGGCLTGSMFASLLTGNRTTDVFLAGLFTGLLPCGLVYAMLALAASQQNIGLGLATMVAFGLGTVPIMVATGLGGSLLSLAARRKVYTLAAWCVVLAGFISIVRGFGFVDLPGLYAGGGCPYCH